MLKTGIEGKQEITVTAENTAKAMGSGTLDVFATPAMIALMEETSWRSIAPFLEEGEGTVGTHLDVSHDAATPIGMKVWAEAELVQVDRKALTFQVTAFDEAGMIGKGTHSRFIISVDRFLSKAEQRKEAR